MKPPLTPISTLVNTTALKNYQRGTARYTNHQQPAMTNGRGYEKAACPSKGSDFPAIDRWGCEKRRGLDNR